MGDATSAEIFLNTRRDELRRQERPLSPKTNEPLPNRHLAPNYVLKQQIRRFIEECRQRGADARSMPTESDLKPAAR